jgi:hypothetical protein
LPDGAWRPCAGTALDPAAPDRNLTLRLGPLEGVVLVDA